MRYSTFGLALAAAMTLFGSNPGYAEQTQQSEAPPVAAVAPPQMASVYPPSRLRPFDMEQCYNDRGCQLATCVSQPTVDGPIVICQSHSTFFP